MGRLQIPRAYNLGNALVIVGVLALGATFWLPHATAARMFRVEQRAETCARRLCEVAKDIPDLDFQAPGAPESILERLEGDRLEPRTAPTRLFGKALFFRSKHYYFMLTRTPPNRDGNGHEDSGTLMAATPQQCPAQESEWRWPWRFADTSRLLPFEVYAWPTTLIGPGVAVFFQPSDGSPAFCRNLDHTYYGIHRYPLPGQGRMQFDGRSRPGMLSWYRGFDNGRWLLPGTDRNVSK